MDKTKIKIQSTSEYVANSSGSRVLRNPATGKWKVTAPDGVHNFGSLALSRNFLRRHGFLKEGEALVRPDPNRRNLR